MESEPKLQEQMEAARQALIGEQGTEPPCPWCGTPRVKRSTYTRCNPCGTNWSDGADLSRDPHVRTVSLASLLAGTSKEDAK